MIHRISNPHKLSDVSGLYSGIKQSAKSYKPNKDRTEKFCIILPLSRVLN